MTRVRNVGVAALARELGLTPGAVSIKMQKGLTPEQIRADHAAGARPKRTAAQREAEASGSIDQRLDRFLHDAEQALGGAELADQMNDRTTGLRLRTKVGKLVLAAEGLYRLYPTITWPECRWPAPVLALDARGSAVALGPKDTPAHSPTSVASVPVKRAIPANLRELVAKVRGKVGQSAQSAPTPVLFTQSVPVPVARHGYDDEIRKISIREELEVQELRKETALAGLREQDLAQKKGELAPVVILNRWFSTCIVRHRDALMRVGPELRDLLAAETDPVKIEELLGDSLRRALRELKLYQVDSAVSESGETGDEEREVA